MRLCLSYNYHLISVLEVSKKVADVVYLVTLVPVADLCDFLVLGSSCEGELSLFHLMKTF
jgi:hypothetical protein